MKQNPLNHIKIASPCSADWDEMLGDQRKRFCTECKLNVYNLSEMTQKEAEKFLFEAEGRVCVRLYKRSDGTVITQNCPVGLEAIKQRVSRIATAAFSIFIGFVGGVFAVSQTPFDNVKLIEDVSVEKPDLQEIVAGGINDLNSSGTKAGKSTGIDFVLMGGTSGPFDSMMWIFTERYPKE
jgi:hypothetical protein